MRELAGVCGGFLVTFVEVEGTLEGLPMARALELGALAKELGCELTVAGGVNAVEQIAELDRAGIDAQVGMAVYKGLIDPADALWACCVSDRPDGLVPTVVCDERGGALGLAYSSRESVRAAYQERRGVYQSRKRGLWRKGESSGAVQELVQIDRDCDSDCLRFAVRQAGAFCHTGTATCFGEERGLGGLAARVRAIAATGGGDGSYTARLLRDPKLLAKKLIEEGGELGREAGGQRVVEEAADVLYFLMVKLQASGVGLAEVEAELDGRALKLARRGGDAKPAFEPGDKLNTGGGT